MNIAKLFLRHIATTELQAMLVEQPNKPDFGQNHLKKIKAFLLLFLVATFFLLDSARAESYGEQSAAQYGNQPVMRPEIAPAWRNLAVRLERDGLGGQAVDALLAQLPPTPTQSPMGRKIRELYNRQFFPTSRSKQQGPYYKGVVTEANAQLCREYIKKHETFFRLAQERYGVPPSIAAALLFVETRLGRVLADIPENAFYTLASMAVSTSPEDIDQWLPKLKGYQKHMGWLEETMHKRANWAYNETRALVRHMLDDKIQPSGLPGSIYGAVGLCQFMPSNISVYGADGDGDGRVDLFNEADAIASLSNYLAKHGWKKDISPERQHKLLMAYNHSTVYANTIMALSSLVSGATQPTPVRQSTKKRGNRQ